VPTGAPPWLAAMEQLNRRKAHAALVRELRQALGHLVSTAPEAVARNVMSIIDAPELNSEEAKNLRDEAVGLLGDLGQRAELLPEVLPALWSSLVHSDQRVRARAVAAWQQIAAAGHSLPSELDELLPALLADRYVIVHTATIRACTTDFPLRTSNWPRSSACCWDGRTPTPARTQTCSTTSCRSSGLSRLSFLTRRA
jgi:hypothetical protein